ncbi:hypothetical protein [Paraburkholderia sp. SIMBA_053]|uniref:hypothetical protein n=1 Tax=Paraburkholderia sp. SIMBA_053 TaxID=3085794 RepID=UPI00397DB235
MADVISTIQFSLEIVKKLRNLNETIKDADIKMLLAELQSELVDAKLEVVGLKEIMTKNAELTRQLETRTSEQPEPMDGGHKFSEKGPYCIKCFETASKKILLPRASGILHTQFGQYHCPVCGNHS